MTWINGQPLCPICERTRQPHQLHHQRRGTIHHDQTDAALDKLSSPTKHLFGENSTNPTTLEK